MEQEMETLESGMRTITENYKENMFTLQTAQTYIKALLKNTRVSVLDQRLPNHCGGGSQEWSQLSGLNRRPTVYKTVALPLS